MPCRNDQLTGPGINPMNHSLVTADRTTHLKIVAVSLVAAIAVILVGITARVTDESGAATNLQAQHGPVIKAGKPSAVTVREGTAVR
jgi:hypothetical protein